MFLSETYYLTMAGPGRGERVVAKIDTSDPAGAEKLLGCGFTDEKGFGFRGLYREEEVRHMFPPGTEIPGTRDGRTGVAEHYRDYRKSPQFLYQGGKLYRVRDGGASLLDIPDTWNFDKVRMAMAGKGAAAHLPDVREDFPARKDVPGHVWKDAAPAPMI